MICMILLKAKLGGHVVVCFDLAGQDKIELPCGVREVNMNAAFELDFQGGVCNVVGSDQAMLSGIMVECICMLLVKSELSERVGARFQEAARAPIGRAGHQDIQPAQRYPDHSQYKIIHW